MRTGGVMEVILVGAKGLKSTDHFLGKIHPYVVVHYRNQEQRSKTARGAGSNPVWNQKFKFSVDYPDNIGADDNGKYRLVLQIMDSDTFTHDDNLGETTIYLKELFEVGLENGRAELPTQKYRVVESDKTYRGEIQVGIFFTAKGEIDQKEYGGWKESQI